MTESFQEETELQIRSEGDQSNPTLIYLPGIHGDWTLLTAFRDLAKEKFFLVQITYPRTLSWSLDQYARAVSKALADRSIHRGWVLAESFSSQVAWAWLKLAHEKAASFHFFGVILAGGFVKYPGAWVPRLAGFFFAIAPWRLWKFGFALYFLYSRFRHRHAPASAGTVPEFIARRTPLDIAAMRHRLRLIAYYDPRPTASRANCPIYLLAGFIDPIVPVWPVLRWLRKNCPAFQARRIIWPADHNVLGTEPAKSLDQIQRWIQARGPDPSKPAT